MNKSEYTQYLKERLYIHFKEVSKYHDPDQILGVFLYGSQNYNSYTEGSDVDSKCILIPTIKELCLSKPVSKEIHLSNGEHCEVKDIREMSKMFKKQNINFLEILYTDYNLINPKYAKTWGTFLDIRDDIVRMNIRATIQSITGQIYNTMRADPKNGKKISNALRFIHFLRKFLVGENYEDCIDIKTYDPEIQKLIMDLKKGEINDDEKSAIVENIFKDAQKLADRLDDYPLGPDDATAALLDRATVNVITNNHFDFNFYNKEI